MPCQNGMLVDAESREACIFKVLEEVGNRFSFAVGEGGLVETILLPV